jgi:peptidoglycan-associated lipoprotein
MKKKTNLLSLLLVMLLISTTLMAQKSFTKAADQAFKDHRWYEAIDMYKKAYTSAKNKSQKAKAIFQIGECYRELGDAKEEEQWYSKAVKAEYEDAICILYLADAQRQQGNYDEATTTYQQYEAKVPSDPRGGDGVKACKDAVAMKSNPTRYLVMDEAQINTKFRDYAPCYANRRMDELIFTSNRKGSTGDAVDENLGENYSDLFDTKRDKNGKWSTPVPLGAPVNTPANEGEPCFDKAFKTMYFTRCAVEKNKVSLCKIYSTVRKGTAWADPVKLAFQIDSITYGHPSLSADGQELFFASNMPGGRGGLDIWMSHYDKKTKGWGEPQNLGPEVNTAGNEMYPFIRYDNTLFFSSDGRGGLGGLDIYKSMSIGTDKWGNTENLGSPINSEGDDFGIIYEGTKDRGFFSSNRPGGRGLDDIYDFYLPPILFVIEGTVYEQESHAKVMGATIRMVGSDGSDVTLKTDTGGFYMYGANGGDRYVKESTSYIISCDGHDIGYLATERTRATESTIGVTNSKTFIHDFVLKKFVPNVEIRFPEVQYGFDSANLRPNSKDSLNFLVHLLNNNPTITIYLDAHTDQRGSVEHNKTLSIARAQSCVNYLISQGIDSARLTPVGWGFSRPLIDIKTILAAPKNEQEALYQKNRRTVFRVNSTKYIPKGHKMTAEDSLKMKALEQIKIEGQEEAADTTEATEPAQPQQQAPNNNTPNNKNNPNNTPQGNKPKQ